MSLMRAFTTRRNRPEMEILSPVQLGRAASQRAGKPVYRSQISGPVALVSTTNMLSYEAPDIHAHAAASSTSSSDEDSDASALSINTSGTTVTDASSIENSPTSPDVEPNHLSCYFKPAVDTTSPLPSRSPSSASRATCDAVAPAPTLPTRGPSHSKRAHEHLHRKRSMQRLMSPPASIRSSTDMFNPFSPTRSAFADAPKEGVFGSELAQLDEVAEELGTVVRDAEAQTDAEAMNARDLAAFGASEYLSEIEELVAATFPPSSATWI